ncbi:hypothetical protein RQP46_004819 [Phenoliferia psychrophenolica]
MAATAPRTKALAPDAKVELVGMITPGREVVFLIGEAGERLSLGVEVESAAAEVLINGAQVVSVRSSSSNGPTMVFLSSAIQLAALHPLVSTLLAALAARSATIISSYHSPSYLVKTPFASSPILYLASAPSAQLAALKAARVLHPFSPPNLIHGLAASLLTLASLANIPATLLLIPTTAAPQPLNGPFAPTKTWSGRNTAGGPDPDGAFSELKEPLVKLKETLGWTWWTPAETQGDGFAWLEVSRKARRREEQSNMYM